MKRQWLYAGVAFASVAEFLFEGLWNEVVFSNSSAELQPLLRATPDLTFNFLSETAFAFAFGFLYLHVPDARRSVRSGAILGTTLGLLIGLYQFLDWYGSLNVSALFVVLHVVKTTLLGTICGVVISFVERRTRGAAHPSSPPPPTQSLHRASRMIGLFLFCTVLAGAQSVPPLDGPHRTFRDSLFERLAGTWIMSGAVRSRPATYSLRAEWVLNHQFLRLDMRDTAAVPAYQASVFIGYDNASDRYVAHWLDAGGGRYSETLGYGRRTDESVLFVFEYPDGPFHTTFAFDRSSSSWSVLMQDQAPDGAWREFAHYALTRTP